MARRLPAALLAIAATALALDAGPSEDVSPDGPLVPVALAWTSDHRLLVALRDARRIAVVDPRNWQVTPGYPLPFRPSDVAVADDHSTVLVGGMDGQFLALDSSGRVVSERSDGRGETRVLALKNGRAAVASRWENGVRIVDWRRGTLLSHHPLPFSPGAMTVRPDGRVIVADAFGGGIADLDPEKPGSARVRALDGANLHALAISGDGKELLVAHMAQYDTVPITESNIDWGLVLSSRLSAIRLSDFDREAPAAAPLPRRRITLDGARHGAADPSALAVTPGGGKVLIALAGARQVLLDDRTIGSATSRTRDLLPLGHNQRLEVVEVGRAPFAIAMAPSGEWAVTADAMDDTLSVVSVKGLSLITTVPLSDRPRSRTAVERGEALFHDGRRALDRWMSCASCHPGGHTNGLNFDTLGDGNFGAPKNTPSLLGVGPTAPYGWTGSFAELADQVHQSLVSSLRGPRPEAGVVEDLTAYLRSLAPPPPQRPGVDPAARRGAAVFHARQCDACHRPPHFMSDSLRDVGLDDGPGGHRRFNPPSLRGVARSAPYLHDGRARSLPEVLRVHDPAGRGVLSASERDDLVAYLESL